MNLQAFTVSPEPNTTHDTEEEGKKRREGGKQVHGVVVDSLDPGVMQNWIEILSLQRLQPHSLKQTL